MSPYPPSPLAPRRGVDIRQWSCLEMRLGSQKTRTLESWSVRHIRHSKYDVPRGRWVGQESARWSWAGPFYTIQMPFKVKSQEKGHTAKSENAREDNQKSGLPLPGLTEVS